MKPLKVKVSELKELKEKLGGWMFAMLTMCSKEKFQYQLNNYKTNAKLQAFGERYENARELYALLEEHLTPKQYMYANMPFYYKIRPEATQKLDPVSGDIQTTVSAVYELTAVCIKRVDITHLTPTPQIYGAYVNVIGESLLAAPQLQQIQKQKECFIDYETEQLKDAFAATDEFFQEQQNQKAERRQAADKEKVERIEKEIQIVNEDLKKQQQEEEDELGATTLSELLDLEETLPKKKHGKKRKQNETSRDTEEMVRQQQYEEAERCSRLAVKRATGH